jgi:hypothetical protein
VLLGLLLHFGLDLAGVLAMGADRRLDLSAAELVVMFDISQPLLAFAAWASD